MKNELTPLEALNEIKEKYKNDNGLQRRLDIIETALKRLEQIEINQTIFEDNPITVSKKIMALEIIKKYFELNELNELVPVKNIPEEDFSFIKDMLL